MVLWAGHVFLTGEFTYTSYFNTVTKGSVKIIVYNI
jgi:hypothetical protein